MEASLRRLNVEVIDLYQIHKPDPEGDIEEAIRASLRSIELRRIECEQLGIPVKIGGYLDTLAHCYYRKGDFAAAVKSQTEAVEQEPHSQTIARQLVVFRRALEQQRANKRSN